MGESISTSLGASSAAELAAYQSAVSADFATSPRASASGLPISAVTSAAYRSVCAQVVGQRTQQLDAARDGEPTATHRAASAWPESRLHVGGGHGKYSANSDPSTGLTVDDRRKDCAWRRAQPTAVALREVLEGLAGRGDGAGDVAAAVDPVDPHRAGTPWL